MPCRLEPTCQAVCQAARHLWLAGRSGCSSEDDDAPQLDQQSTHAPPPLTRPAGDVGAESSSNIARMARVESMYRTVLDRNDDIDCGSSCCAEQQKEAKEKLALILLQSGRSRDADELLASLGYTCRLASRIFNYETLLSAQPPLQDAKTTISGTTKEEDESNALSCCFCKVFDSVLNDDQLQLLQTVFGDVNSSYWTNHAYSVEPSPSPYYSYVLPMLLPQPLRHGKGGGITENDTCGSLYSIIYRLRDILQPHFPTIKNAHYVEVWAHNRPHATGHQFHFDSDNEGCTEVIRNPIVSCVLYLSGGNNVLTTGSGPTVVTNQRLSSRQLASKAWLVPATQSNRLIAFDGKLLHGVVPGSGSSRHRRVSLMLAFWKKIRVRQQPGAAACRWPAPGSLKAEWAEALMMTPTTAAAAVAAPTKQQNNLSSGGKQVTIEILPVVVSPVYETIPGGQPWSSRLGVPDYELMFQGM
jgi:hypothetical protein